MVKYDSNQKINVLQHLHLFFLKYLIFYLKQLCMKIVLFAVFISALLSFSNNIPCNNSLKKYKNNNFQDTSYTIWLEKKQVKPMNVIYTIDTTNKKADIDRIISQRRGDIFVFAAKEKLNTGLLMVQYNINAYPYVFETSVEVDKLPSALYCDINRKIIYSKTAVVAHFKGNTKNLNMAYAAVAKWLLENKAIANGLPYEINLNDPNMITDANNLLVDVYQPIK
jgi:effector-binding domain-containing protein